MIITIVLLLALACLFGFIWGVRQIGQAYGWGKTLAYTGGGLALGAVLIITSALAG